jgi:hypothetical protein
MHPFSNDSTKGKSYYVLVVNRVQNGSILDFRLRAKSRTKDLFLTCRHSSLEDSVAAGPASLNSQTRQRLPIVSQPQGHAKHPKIQLCIRPSSSAISHIPMIGYVIALQGRAQASTRLLLSVNHQNEHGLVTIKATPIDDI